MVVLTTSSPGGNFSSGQAKFIRFMVGVVMGVIVKLSFVWSSELMMFVYSVKTRNRRRTSLPIFVLTCYESKNVQVVFLSLTSLLFTQP